MLTEKIIKKETKKFINSCYKDDIENLNNINNNLSNYGIDIVNSPDLPINIALKERNIRTIKWLIENNADTSHITKFSDLSILVKYGMKPTHYHLLNIIQKIKNINERDYLLKFLLENGAVPNISILNMVNNDTMFEIMSDYMVFDKYSFSQAIKTGNLRLVMKLYEANHNEINLNPHLNPNYNLNISFEKLIEFRNNDPVIIAHFFNQHLIKKYLESQGAYIQRFHIIVNKETKKLEYSYLE